MRWIMMMLPVCMISARAYGLVANRATGGEELGIITLGGIVHTATEDNIALIKEVTSGKVKAVKAGNTILNQFTIRKIARKYILLEKKSGELILVYQSKFEDEFKNIGQQQSQTDYTISKLAVGTSEQYSEDGFERKFNKIRMTGAFRENLLKHHLAKVMMQATAIPYMEGNQVRGFALTEIEEGSIYQHIGFVPADIITAINGVSLNDAASAIRLLQSLREANNVDIEVIRGGAPVTISAVVQ